MTDPFNGDGITVVIADDEGPARRGLRDLLAGHADVHVVAEAVSGQQAIDAIETHSPDLVFLDIQMPEGDGFDVIRAIGVEAMPLTIFATAYNEYALKAFDAHAIDYLLKPFDRDRFEAALIRARRFLSRVEPRPTERLDAFLKQLEQRSAHLRRIPVRVGERIRLLDVNEIEYFEADSNYVRLHTARGAPLIRESLSAVEARLDPQRFLRVHRSFIVQLSRVAEVESLGSGEYVLFLHGGKKLTTGRSYRAAVGHALGLKG